jgi:hypothetical protein
VVWGLDWSYGSSPAMGAARGNLPAAVFGPWEEDGSWPSDRYRVLAIGKEVRRIGTVHLGLGGSD